MMSHSAVHVEVVLGDITEQPDIDAVVNAANSMLMSGGGVCGAIFRQAGPELNDACRPLAPLEVGGAVATPGFGLPNPHIIHAVGPRYGKDRPEADLLARAYITALTVADALGTHSIAFPALSTGIFGYPMAEASEIAFTAVDSMIPALRAVRLIRFVLFDQNAHAQFLEAQAQRFR
jgi:O-acetyl-ADP-ribose deacetylase